MERAIIAGIAGWLVMAAGADAQSVLDRGPNVTDGWTGAPNSIHFNFLHRFNSSGPPRRQVINRPTFEIAYRAPIPLLLGVRHATRSDVAPGIPNEWELYARYGVLLRDNGAPFDVSILAARNFAARSFDGELTVARTQGPVRVIAVGRVLGSAFDSGDTRFVLGGGASLRLARWLAVAGDYAFVHGAAYPDDDVEEDDKGAWGAAVQLGLPYTPHSISLQVTNTNTATVQGSSRGADDVRYGFEFTIPVSLSRYFGPRVVAAPPPPPPNVDSLRAAVADSVTRVLTREYELRLALDTEQRAARADSIRAAQETAARLRQAALRDSARADSVRAARRAPAAQVRTTIRDASYAQPRLAVTRGTTITWRNDSQLDHTVTAVDGTWDSGLIKPGQTWQRTFSTPGTFDFFCTPHPFMKGTVTVRAEP